MVETKLAGLVYQPREETEEGCRETKLNSETKLNLSHHTCPFMSTCPFNTHMLCSTEEMLLAFDRYEMHKFTQEFYNEVGVTASYVPSTDYEKNAFRECVLRHLRTTNDVRAKIVRKTLSDKKYRDALRNVEW